MEIFAGNNPSTFEIVHLALKIRVIPCIQNSKLMSNLNKPDTRYSQTRKEIEDNEEVISEEKHGFGINQANKCSDMENYFLSSPSKHSWH